MDNLRKVRARGASVKPACLIVEPLQCSKLFLAAEPGLRNRGLQHPDRLVVNREKDREGMPVLATSAGLISKPVNWIGDPNTALFALTVPYIWRTLPFAVLLVHAALQGINPELFEAASVDGAGAFTRFRHITLPLLVPILVVLLVLRTSFAFVVFEEVLAITQGGPGDATWVAVWYSYKRSFAPPFDIGIGAASAYVLALIIGALALAYVTMIYRRIE